MGGSRPSLFRKGLVRPTSRSPRRVNAAASGEKLGNPIFPRAYFSRNPRLPQLQPLSARYNLIPKKRRKKEGKKEGKKKRRKKEEEKKKKRRKKERGHGTMNLTAPATWSTSTRTTHGLKMHWKSMHRVPSMHGDRGTCMLPCQELSNAT